MSVRHRPDSVQELRVRRAQEEARARAASIAFVTLAETGQLDDVTTTENTDLFIEWAYPIAYTVGQIRRFNGRLFRVAQAHTSQADWTPDATPALWVLIGDPGEEWPEWAQPIGAHDAYMRGDRVTHNGGRWVSDIDGNVWPPGVHGWTEQAIPTATAATKKKKGAK